MKPIILLAALAPLALGACATLFGPASPFALDRKGDLVEFNYAWSAEASRNPRLVRRLRGDLERAFKASASAAQAERERSRATGEMFKGHRYTRRWTTAGQSARLLSLDGRLSVATATGQSQRSDGLLWDRSTATQIGHEQLFAASSSAASLVTGPGCAMLARATSPRGGSVATGQCPGAVAVMPADRNDNRLFDHFRFVAPGAAGGNGSLVFLDLPVTAQLLAAIKPTYRPGFEIAQSPQ